MAPFESAMVVSYRLSIVTVALSICDRMSPTLKSTGVGHFGPKFPGDPIRVDPRCLGLQRANILGQLMVNYFGRIPTYVIIIHQRHRTDEQTDSQTDRWHAIARPRFAL